MSNKDYNEFSTSDPTIKEFRKQFDSVAEECSIDGDLMNSHKIPSSVTVQCENDDGDYEIVGMSVSAFGGCGCWMGPKIIIRKVSS